MSKVEELLKAKDLMEKDFTSRLASSNEIIEQLRDKLKGKESELTDLTATNSKLTNEISSLSETLDARAVYECNRRKRKRH